MTNLADLLDVADNVDAMDVIDDPNRAANLIRSLAGELRTSGRSIADTDGVRSDDVKPENWARVNVSAFHSKSSAYAAGFEAAWEERSARAARERAVAVEALTQTAASLADSVGALEAGADTRAVSL